MLSSSRGQANFRGLEASRPRPRTSKCVLEDSTSLKNTLLGQYYKEQYGISETKQYKLRQTQQEQKYSLEILPIDKMLAKSIDKAIIDRKN